MAGGKLTSALGLHFESHREGVRTRTAEELSWDFTSRRGDIDGVMVGIDGSDATRIGLTFPDATPSAEPYELTLAELRSETGQLARSVGSVELVATEVDPNAPRTAQFTYREATGTERRGSDYYYVRVVQLDGHLAWSSPIWVDRASAAPPR